MKTLQILISTFVLLIIGANAFAIQVGDQVTFNDQAYGNTYTTGGGGFNAYIDGQYVITTFCLEKTEHIDFSNTFTVSSIEKYATGGGVGAVDGKDYLSGETQWLYWNFYNGTLDDVYSPYSETSDDWADALQYAIWFLENEIASLAQGSKAMQLVTAAQQALQNCNVDLGNVWVMNITYQNGKEAQSQLIAAPVPEPATFILLGSGLAGLALYRRRG